MKVGRYRGMEAWRMESRCRYLDVKVRCSHLYVEVRRRHLDVEAKEIRSDKGVLEVC